MKTIITSSKAAIDLASIMVGIIVIGLIGGVIAATVFAIIPWAQDNAAKQQLDAIHTAENAFYGLSAEGQAPYFASSSELATKGLLSENENYCITVDSSKQGYTAVVRSDSGNVFTSRNDNPKPFNYKRDTCLGPGVEQPTSVFIINCPTGVTSAKIPINALNGTITWSDGVETRGTVPSRTVTPNTAYTVTVEGTFRDLNANLISLEERSCVREMRTWDYESGTVNASSAFSGLPNLIRVPNNLPSTVTNVVQMFSNSKQFNGNISEWDTSNLDSMQRMFAGATNFNSDISQWNVSNVKIFAGMFDAASNFNQPIGNWKTDSAVDMDAMFRAAERFNQPIGNWNVSNVTNMSSLFNSATVFNQPLNNWNVSKVTNMTALFQSQNYNQPLNQWTPVSAEKMDWMFFNNQTFNQDISSWDTTKVLDMTRMFGNASKFNQNISNWNVVNAVTKTTGFHSGSALTAANTPAALRNK